MEELTVNEDTDSVLCQNDIRLAIQRAEIFAACAWQKHIITFPKRKVLYMTLAREGFSGARIARDWKISEATVSQRDPSEKTPQKL